MDSLKRAPVTFQNDPAAEAERWAAFQEAVAVHDKLHTPASAALRVFAHRTWQAAFLNESASLHVISGGRRAG